MWPLLLRPEPRFWLSVSASTGPPLCRCGWTTLTIARRPADVGLTFCKGISALRAEIDFLAGGEAHIRLLPRPAPADVAAEALDLTGDVHDLDAFHLDLEHRLDGGLHFGLRCIRHHLEDHLLEFVRDVRALFRHDGREQDRCEPLGVVSGGARARLHFLGLFSAHARPPWTVFAMFVSAGRPPGIARRRALRAFASPAPLIPAFPRI